MLFKLRTNQAVVFDMKKIHTLIMIAVCGSLLLLASCSTTTDSTVTSDGTSVTQTRSVSVFDNIAINGTQTVHIIYASQQKVEVVGANNLQPYFVTDVANGNLQLGYVDTVTVSSDNIYVNVYTPNLSKFTINGDGNADVTGNYYGQSPNLVVNGAGTLTLNNLANTTLNATVNGAGYVNGFTSVCETLNANVVGTGRIEMKVLTTLNASINGSGAIVYDGSPTVSSNISNGGLVYHK